MTDLGAAVGRQQLRRLPVILERRRAAAARYAERLREMPGIQAPLQPAWARSNWQSYCVRLVGGAQRQRAVMQAMLDQGVATRRGVMCAHLEGAYADRHLRHALPEFERARDGCVLLPLYPQMTEGEQDRVIQSLQRALLMTAEPGKHQGDGCLPNFRCLQ